MLFYWSLSIPPENIGKPLVSDIFKRNKKVNQKDSMDFKKYHGAITK